MLHVYIMKERIETFSTNGNNDNIKKINARRTPRVIPTAVTIYNIIIECQGAFDSSTI